MSASLSHEQIPMPFAEAMGLDPYEVWSGGRGAQKALAAYKASAEGQARLREFAAAEQREKEQLKLVRRWAETLGCSFPTDAHIRAYGEKHGLAMGPIWAAEAVREAVAESAAESELDDGGEFASPRTPEFGPNEIRYRALDATWDGYDLVWSRDDERAAAGQEKEAEHRAREEALRSAPDPSDFSAGAGYSKVL